MNPIKSWVIALALAVSLVGPARSDSIEKKQVTLGVGGKAALYYLPLTICDRLGYFREQGLDVTINDFRGGAQSLQALVGGSVDVVTGAYEHTIRMQAKGSQGQQAGLLAHRHHSSGGNEIGCRHARRLR